MSQITKRQLRDALEIDTDSALAEFFGISPSAVSQWAMDEPIPMLRALQATVKRPGLFGRNDPVDQQSDDAPRSRIGGPASKLDDSDQSPHDPQIDAGSRVRA